MYKSLFETDETGVEVKGYLNLNGCKNLTSLGNLKSVGGYLDLRGCKNLTSLGNLKSVGRHLNLRGCKNLTSLGNLKSVGGQIYMDKGLKIKIPKHLNNSVAFL